MLLMTLTALTALAEQPTGTDLADTELEAPAAVQVTRATYRLDPARSDLYVIVYNDASRFTPVTGHDHAVEASRFDGTVVWDTADAGACDVNIQVPVSGLVIDPPGLRERAGLDPEGSIPDGQKSTVISNMSGKKNLNAALNPTVAFRANRCAGTTGSVPVTGTMTIAGVSKEITVPMTVQADASSFSATGRYEFNHSDYSMTPFTYGPLTPKNLERLTIVIDLRGDLTEP